VKHTRSGAVSTRGSVTVILTVAVVVILALSAYVVIEVSSLQSQISSLQDQNSDLQNQLVNVEQAENLLQSRLNSPLTTSTQTKPFSFAVQDVCISANPICWTYPGHQGEYVYALTIVNNGTVEIPVTSSVYIRVDDNTSSLGFGFNTTLPAAVQPGHWVYLNSTSWSQVELAPSINMTSKLAPGDLVALAISVENVQVYAFTNVPICTSTTTTFQNYTSTQTATLSSCVT